VLVDDVLAAAGIEPPTKFILAHSFGCPPARS
jgi:hypothetical protein